VVVAGVTQQLELRIGEGRQGAAQLPCQIRTARPVAGVAVLVRPSCVVEEGEQVYHQWIGSGWLRQPSSILEHAPPVGQAVDPHQAEIVSLYNAA
jgi:hypothetical protein